LTIAIMQLLNVLCEIEKHKYQSKITLYGFLPHILNLALFPPQLDEEGKVI